MFECIFSLIVCVSILSFIFVVASVVILLKSDVDLLLLLMTKIGKQPASLARKVVWVTGASSGIGEYVVYELANAGCRLVLSARRKGELERVKEACLKTGKVTDDDVFVLPLDITKCDTHKKAVQQVLEKFGQVDILFNNAGRSQRAAWLDVELDVDRQMFETDVFGQVSLTQEVLPHMIERGKGHIAVMSSMSGKIGAPMSRSYTGAKHALQGYFDSLRTEMGAHNIDVTVICPGPVFSNLFIPAFTGKVGEELNRPMASNEKRMSTSRCAYLSCVAVANRMYEVWLSEQPILAMCYLNQYFPTIGKWTAKKFGVAALLKLREGK